MAGDPLYEPLGQPKPPRVGASRVRARWLLAPLGVAALAAGAWMVHTRGRTDGGAVVARIEVAPKTREPAASDPAPVGSTPPVAVAVAAAPAAESGTTVEVQNGVKVIRFNPSASTSSIMIPVLDAGAIALKPAPDPRISESTRAGTLPKLGPNGLRPADVYARPAVAAAGPRLALILAGAGTDQLATADAARRLPPAIVFAFAPEVADAPTQVSETRRAGHEVLLNLREAAAASDAPAVAPAGLEALHRRMAGFAGYVGVLPAAVDDAEGRDMVGRGLLLVEAPPAAAGLAIDLTIDASQGSGVVRDALSRLAGMARAKGHAVGLIERATLATGDIAAVAGALPKDGITLVPITASGLRASDLAKAAP